LTSGTLLLLDLFSLGRQALAKSYKFEVLRAHRTKFEKHSNFSKRES